MYPYRIFLYFLFFTSSTLHALSADNSKHIKDEKFEQNGQTNVRALPRCGETHSTDTGAIFYKTFEPVLEHERCAWIIGVPEAVGYSINLQYLGRPTNEEGSGQELILTGVRYNEQGSPILTTYLPTDVGVFTVSNANLVIITFHSSFQNDVPSATGFYLQYESIQTGDIPRTSALSTHHVIDAPTFKFKYPPLGKNYSDTELAAFLFPSGSNLYSGLDNNVWYKSSGLQPGCADSLFVYHFVISENPELGNWQEVGRICDNATSQTITHDDLVLIIFQSDAAIQDSGFWFWFMGC